MAKKQTRQPRYEVELYPRSTSGIPIGRAKWEFRVFHDGKRVGTLEVSRGSVTWLPAFRAADQTVKFNWQQFAKCMAEEAEKRQ